MVMDRLHVKESLINAVVKFTQIRILLGNRCISMYLK